MGCLSRQGGAPRWEKTRIIIRHRSSETGQFIPEKDAKRHPSTTEKARIRVPVKKKSGCRIWIAALLSGSSPLSRAGERLLFVRSVLLSMRDELFD